LYLLNYKALNHEQPGVASHQSRRYLFVMILFIELD
jgi:hypothetical protein